MEPIIKRRKTSQTTFLLFTLCILFGSPLFASNRDCPLELLNKYAYTYSEERTSQATEEWLAFKKNNPEPMEVDLSKASLANSWHEMPSDYAKIIASLKDGDTVIIDGERFVITNFLGAGDTTHIFGITKFPGVIRLPFVTPSAMLLTLTPDPNLVGRRVNYVSTMDLLNSDYSPGTILPDPRGLGRYTLISRINGSTNGKDYLKSLGNPDSDPKAQSLLKTMQANGDGDDLEMAKSYLWDEHKERWFYIDGKDEAAFTGRGAPF